MWSIIDLATLAGQFPLRRSRVDSSPGCDTLAYNHFKYSTSSVPGSVRRRTPYTSYRKMLLVFAKVIRR